MDSEEKWYFTKEQLANTPSRKCGYDVDRELSCRQQAANFIQDMGQRLQVTQLCINTAIVYMHRFYVFHSFTQFHRNAMAAAALFLAAKVEEQPRKLEHVIKVAQMCLHRELPPLDTKSEAYLEQAQDLVMNENVLLQTLGFDVAIDHPHTHVVRCCHLVKASKDLAQTSYFMASNSLHLTTMCLQYKPTVVACFCIHLACKWSNWEIPLSNESKSWFWYVDRSVTQELLEQLTDEFLRIFEKCPSRLKRKITTYQNMSGYHMGSNELSTKRLPGGELQQGVSFQQPINRSRPLNDESRKKMEGLLPPTHRPPVPVPDFKKQQLLPPPPPPPAHSQQLPSGMPFNASTFHMGPSTSQASGSHQSMGAQFMYPMPPTMTSGSVNSMSTPMAMPHMTNPMLNIRVPPPPPPPQAASGQKHSIRPEAMFPPPKRSSGHSSTRSHSAKTETQNLTQQPTKAYSLSHHGPRNGTEHMSVTQLQPQIKTEMKYQQPPEKHSSHHKGHSKYESSRSQSSSVSWSGSGDGLGRSTTVESKHSKADSFHMTMPMIASVKQEPAPPLPPPPLPPPPPPPPPVVPPPPPSSKPSSIFSPHKMTPPLPSTPPRDIKPNILSPMLLSPLTPNKSGRNRTSSSSSEPELIPVMPKLEDISGFESLARGKTAIKLPTKVPDTLQHPKEKRKESLTTNVSKEVKQEPIQNTRAVEITDKVFVSEPIEIVDSPVAIKREHKKKKKHKEHREHKEHKDKEKDKEKKKDKHKEKHRDKEREKEKEKTREDPAPIKITIPKDKIGKIIPPPVKPEQNASLKIKIPKDKLVNAQVEQQNWFSSSSSLKIKISKDALLSVSSAPPSASKSSSSSSSKKRERSSHKNEDGRYSHTSKHAKLSKANGYRSSEGDFS